MRIYFYAAIAAIVVALSLWYRHSLIQEGKQQCQANIERAIKQQQDIANENSFVYEGINQKNKIEYRTKIKEVEKIVPTNRSCDLPDSTVRMLNNTIKGE